MLIFTNGHITWSATTAKTLFDDEGNPLRRKGGGLTAECYIDTLTENKKGQYEDGKFTQYSLSVSINLTPDTIAHPPKNIRLHHKYKGDLGEFVVQRTEYYELTQTMTLWV